MEGRLSNSVLLRQIIPKVKETPDGPKEIKSLCSTRTIQPVELIAKEQKSILTRFDIQPKQKEQTEQKPKESVITDELIERLNKLKQASEFGNILKGSKLGLTAYQKPSDGIPVKDLSSDLRTLISRTEIFLNTPKDNSLAYGHVRYNQITKQINFYSVDDNALTKVIGSIDVTKFPNSVTVDKNLNINSNNAITNSTVTQQLQIIKNTIPEITAEGETLKIEKRHG